MGLMMRIECGEGEPSELAVGSYEFEHDGATVTVRALDENGAEIGSWGGPTDESGEGCWAAAVVISDAGGIPAGIDSVRWWEADSEGLVAQILALAGGI